MSQCRLSGTEVELEGKEGSRLSLDTTRVVGVNGSHSKSPERTWSTGS